MAIKILIIGFIALSVICVFIMKKISPEAWGGISGLGNLCRYCIYFSNSCS